MILTNKRLEKSYKFDLEDCTPEELAKLKKIAMERFPLDEAGQIQYATCKILEDQAERYTKIEKLLIKQMEDSKKKPPTPAKAKSVKSTVVKPSKGIKNGTKNKRRK